MMNRLHYVGVGSLVAVATLVGVAWFVQGTSTEVHNSTSLAIAAQSDSSSTTNQFAPEISAASVAPQLPDGYTQYQNAIYHFSFIYSASTTVKEYPGAGGTLTLVYQRAAGEPGFQIYIQPYSDTQITKERFLKDEPSGVKNNSQSIRIGDAPAESFYSSNTSMGETAEIWFIRDGYLYEAVTYKELAPWLSQIMQTWKFTN